MKLSEIPEYRTAISSRRAGDMFSFRECLKVCETKVSSDLHKALLERFIAESFEHEGNLDEAFVHLCRACDVDPAPDSFYEAAAFVWRNSRDCDKAEELLNQALARGGEFDDVAFDKTRFKLDVETFLTSIKGHQSEGQNGIGTEY